jgi:riboflavin biosynthesis pyrimidine reductase
MRPMTLRTFESNDVNSTPAPCAERPYITVQIAQTLDGKIALPLTRTLLSSREGLETAHRARSQHDAVLVGSSTVRIDNPELTVRYCRSSTKTCNSCHLT